MNDEGRRNKDREEVYAGTSQACQLPVTANVRYAAPASEFISDLIAVLASSSHLCVLVALCWLQIMTVIAGAAERHDVFNRNVPTSSNFRAVRRDLKSQVVLYPS